MKLLNALRGVGLPAFLTRTFVAVPVAGLGAVGATLVGWAQSDEHAPGWALAAGISSAVVAAGYGPWAAHTNERRIKDLRREVAAAEDEGARRLSDGMHSIVFKMLKMHGRRWTKEDAESFIESALDSIARLINVPRVRACLYTYDQVEDPDNPASIRGTLNDFGYHANRSDIPRKAFDESSEHGAALLEMLRNNESRLISDVDQPAIPVDCSGRSYRGFIAASVVWKGRPLAILTVDTPEPGVLNEKHETVTRLACQFLAAALHSKDQTAVRSVDMRAAMRVRGVESSEGLQQMRRVLSNQETHQPSIGGKRLSVRYIDGPDPLSGEEGLRA